MFLTDDAKYEPNKPPPQACLAYPGKLCRFHPTGPCAEKLLEGAIQMHVERSMKYYFDQFEKKQKESQVKKSWFARLIGR